MVYFNPLGDSYTNAGHRVKLIHPVDALNITFPATRSAAQQFLDDNCDLMAKAAAEGRDLRSIAHKRVKPPEHGEQTIGGYIDPANPGNIQYRILISSAPADSGVEYNVENSCPHLYPVLGLVRQADEKMIGMVSMDFEDRLCEKVAAVFNTFMKPYSTMRLWEDLSGDTLSAYLLKANMPGSWCDAGKSTHNGFGSAAELEKACEEFRAQLTSPDWEHLDAVLKAAPSGDLAMRHRLLKALQGSEKFIPALWICLGNGECSAIAPENFTTYLLADVTDTDSFRHISVAAGEVYKEWKWRGCRFVAPWILLQCVARDSCLDIATRWLTRTTAAGDAQKALSNLADAISVAWPNHFAHLVELRVDVEDILDTSPRTILDSFYVKTPVGVILGSRTVSIAIRGSWRKA